MRDLVSYFVPYAAGSGAGGGGWIWYQVDSSTICFQYFWGLYHFIYTNRNTKKGNSLLLHFSLLKDFRVELAGGIMIITKKN
jgi:hypothetical protein